MQQNLTVLIMDNDEMEPHSCCPVLVSIKPLHFTLPLIPPSFWKTAMSAVTILLLSIVAFTSALDEAGSIWGMLSSCGEGHWWMRDAMEHGYLEWLCSNATDGPQPGQSEKMNRKTAPAQWPNPAYWPKDYRPQALEPLKKGFFGECLQVNFDPICFDHLACYSTCGKTKEQCDEEFKQSMYRWCNVHKGGIFQQACRLNCKKVAWGNYQVVSWFGSGYYPEMQQDFCKCPKLDVPSETLTNEGSYQ